MSLYSTSRALWLSSFMILVFLFFTLNSESIKGISISRTQTPVVPPPPPPPPADDVTCKKLGMIKESSCPLPSCSMPFIKPIDSTLTPPTQRPLITYAYHETPFARDNLRFFVDHALHGAADFIFILNGDTDVDKTIIFADPDIPEDLVDVIPKRDMRNVYVKKRPNTCFDLGAHYEVLNNVLGGDGWIGHKGPIPAPYGMAGPGDEMLLRNRYKRYILMNASIRGPFVPRWSTQCWSDSYLNRLTNQVKLVGMAYNCHTDEGHIQSMIWATDHVGLQLILTKEGIAECFHSMGAAMDAEVRTTPLLRDNGYEVDTFLSVYHKENKKAKYERMRAKKAKGIKQFRRGAEGKEEPAAEKKEEPAAATEAAKTPPTPEESAAAAEKEKQEKEAAEAASAAAAAEAAKPTLTPAEIAAAEKEKQKQEAAAAAAAKIQKEKNDALLLKHDNDMPGYFWRECTAEDWLGPKSYFGTFVHPYENLFMKSHRKIEDTVLDLLTEWHDGMGYESWDVCR